MATMKGTQQMKKQKQPTPKKQATSEVDRLRLEIAKLTGRSPESGDPRYLAQRLADLKKRKDAGDDIKHRAGEPQSVMSISMPSSARIAIGKVLDREKLGQSEAARKAFALLAADLGYSNEAAAIRGES